MIFHPGQGRSILGHLCPTGTMRSLCSKDCSSELGKKVEKGIS